jgi:hypothetical protein
MLSSEFITISPVNSLHLIACKPTNACWPKWCLGFGTNDEGPPGERVRASARGARWAVPVAVRPIGA